MITPLDIENKKFSKQMMNGYSVEEVDDFLDELTACYEKLKRKLAMLEGKEIDLIQENYQELIKCLSDNIIEMIFKATVGNRESDAN